MDTVDRIFELVDAKYKDQKDFAADIGVTDKTVSAWRTRRVKSYGKHLSKIAVVLGTTTDYLVTGDGPKKRGSRPAVSESDTVSEASLKAAFFEGGEDLTREEMDELWEDAKDYIQYKLTQRRRKKNDK